MKTVVAVGSPLNFIVINREDDKYAVYLNEAGRLSRLAFTEAEFIEFQAQVACVREAGAFAPAGAGTAH